MLDLGTIQVIVLGLVQGLTEFLPVSSSGHLVIVPYLLSWEQPPLAFDVALHLGTLFAVVAYFAGDLWFLGSRGLGLSRFPAQDVARARRTIALLALGSVPAGLAGFFLEDFFESVFSGPLAARSAAMFLLLTAGILYGAETLRRRRATRTLGEDAAADARIDIGRDESTLGWVDATVIGVGQALAIFPGISRSGATIAAGMIRGLSRQGSARYSFLLSIPAILGAFVLKAGELIGNDVERSFSDVQVGIGMLVAAVSGFWAIRYLLRLVVTDDLMGFARYVALFGVLTFVGTLWLGPVSQV